GLLVQLDNIVEIEEQSSPPQLYHNNRYMSATVSAGLAPGYSMGDGIAAMDAIKDRVLDATFTTDLGGEARDYVESSSNTIDRKSTRLNSSHVKISYAVFCLKNKQIGGY